MQEDERDVETKVIGLVDDHLVVRLGIELLFRDVPDLHLAATAETVPSLLDSGVRFDLVLLDLTLGDGSSPEANVRLLQRHGIPALAFTSGDNPYLIRSAARGGVRGVLRKSVPPTEFLEGIRHALDDGAELLGLEWAAALDADPALAGIQLSPRQREVLELFASGESAKRVALRTGLAQATVTDYLLRIRAKYAEQGRDTSSKVALYQRAVEDGLLPPPRRSDEA